MTARNPAPTPGDRQDVPPHFCPGCGAEQRDFLRYPWYFCRECRDLAQDGSGRRIEFGNTSLSGGFAWQYRDAPATRTECLGVICLIRLRPVVVHEARFGGIAVEPWNSTVQTPPGYWQMTGDKPFLARDRS